MNKTIDKVVTFITIISFIGTILSWVTTNKVAFIVTIIFLCLSLIYVLVRFFMRRVPLQRHEEYEPFEKFLADADKVDIIGINLAGIVSGHQGFIEEKAKKGCKFRFILTDPALANSIPMSLQTKRNTGNAFDLLKRIMRKSDNVELGLLRYTPAYGLLIKHIDAKSHNVIQVEIYSQIEVFSDVALAHKRPHFLLTQISNKYWYNYFCDEFEEAWRLSTRVV